MPKQQLPVCFISKRAVFHDKIRYRNIITLFNLENIKSFLFMKLFFGKVNYQKYMAAEINVV